MANQSANIGNWYYSGRTHLRVEAQEKAIGQFIITALHTESDKPRGIPTIYN